MNDRCGFIPPDTVGYDPCHRVKGHDGPCAHRELAAGLSLSRAYLHAVESVQEETAREIALRVLKRGADHESDASDLAASYLVEHAELTALRRGEWEPECGGTVKTNPFTQDLRRPAVPAPSGEIDHEVRFDHGQAEPDGAIDEVVGVGTYHAEMMDKNLLWIQLGPDAFHVSARGNLKFERW